MGSLFGIPGMLFWGAAASIPILIHLFARQRFKRVPWAAMDFLSRAFKKMRRRIRLEHILLLILRILAILLFVLALAKPLVDASGILGGSDSRREVVLLLDTSFSMGLKDADGSTHFARSREQAVRLIGGLRSDRGDTVSVVTTGRPPRVVLKGSGDLEKAKAEVETLEVTDASTDYLSSLQTAIALLDDLSPGAEVFLLSDFQKVGFQSEGPEASGGTTPDDRPQQVLSSRVQELLAKKATLTLVKPRESSTDNLAITDLSLRERAVIAGAPARVQVVVKNFGSKPQRGIVQLYADGASTAVDVRDLDIIAPGQIQIADFRHAFPTAGSHSLEARFITDVLEADNVRRLAVEVRERIATLIVDGDPKPDVGDQESYFLSAALDPALPGARPLFSVEVTEETRFDTADLSKVDLLVLMNVALLSRQRAESIQRFVEEGGGLLVFLGDRIQPQSLNTLLWKSGAGVLPAEVLDAVGNIGTKDVAFGMTSPNYGHPALQYFEDPEVRTWLSLPPVYRFYRTRIGAEDAKASVLASFDRAGTALPMPEPAILDKSVGNGKTLLVTTSGDQDWTDLPAFPTYLLLAREMAFHLTRRDSRFENLLVNDSYGRILRGFAKEVALAKDGEQMQILKPLALEGERGYEIRTPTLEKAGLYRLDLSGQEAGAKRDLSPIYFAANVDTQESDLTRVSDEWVTANFPGDGVRIVADIESASEAKAKTRDGRGWWWALLLALLLLAAETALSQIFGLRSSGGAA